MSFQNVLRVNKIYIKIHLSTWGIFEIWASQLICNKMMHNIDLDSWLYRALTQFGFREHCRRHFILAEDTRPSFPARGMVSLRGKPFGCPGGNMAEQGLPWPSTEYCSRGGFSWLKADPARGMAFLRGKVHSREECTMAELIMPGPSKIMHSRALAHLAEHNLLVPSTIHHGRRPFSLFEV